MATSTSTPADASDRVRPDLRSLADIREVVDAFYGDIREDPVLGQYFANLDLDRHRSTMVDFWASVVYQTGTYRGRPFDAHIGLQDLSARHFVRWLNRFERVVDARFAGEAATRMKARARQIAFIFQAKLGIDPMNAPA